MKIVIIGGGITGLYIGYMLKKHNIDFDIYERSNIIGGKIINNTVFDKEIKYQIYPHHTHMINLLKELNINYEINTIEKTIKFNKKLFKKIKHAYKKNPIINISVSDFVKKHLTENEYKLFISYIIDRKLDLMEISDYMKFNHDDILKINRSKHQININYSLIEKLNLFIHNHIKINHNVQQISYMPITRNYLLLIDDKLINADKVILTTNMNIHLILPQLIQSQFTKIDSFNHLKIYYQSDDNNLSSIDYITNNNDILYESIILNKKSTINLLNKFFNNKIKISKYTYHDWKNAYHINKYTIETDFYIKYGMILAIHPYLNSLEGSCICAIKTFDIIQN